MGTRGNVVIRQHKTGRIITNIYNHMDSYPSGLGVTLAAFLKDRSIINGTGDEIAKVSNGIGDLSAQVVTYLKGSHKNIGGVYLDAPLNPLKDANDYTYLIYPVTRKKTIKFRDRNSIWHEPLGGVMVEVYHWEKMVFSGTADEYVKWVQTAD